MNSRHEHLLLAIRKWQATAFLCEAADAQVAAWVVDKFVKWFFREDSFVDLPTIQ